MRKITLLLTLLAVSLGYSQQVVIEDFEGTSPTTTWYDAGEGATVGVSSAQASGGVNSLELITEAAGQNWQGAALLMQNNKIDMTGADKTLSVDIYSTVARSYLVKLVNGDQNAPIVIPEEGYNPGLDSKTYVDHSGGGWETLIADFNVGADTGQPGYNPPNDQFSAIVFFPFYNPQVPVNPAGGWFDAEISATYIDNLKATAGDQVLGVEDYQVVKFSTFPNPTQNSWTISTKNESITSIQVFDVLGKNVLSLLPNERTAVIDGASFKAGLYFAQIKTVSGLSSLKLIKK
jgi:hypothetical protein